MNLCVRNRTVTAENEKKKNSVNNITLTGYFEYQFARYNKLKNSMI